MTDTSKFALGDKVEWQNGRTASYYHVGTVVGVLPGLTTIFTLKMEEPYRSMRLPAPRSNWRWHESYIVYVPGKGKGRLYWPRVGGLRRIER